MEEIRDRCRGVGLVTVYRTLDLLSELGVVRRLDLGDGPRYELAEDHHHHLICAGCGSVAEFEQCPLDPARLPQVWSDFEIRAHSLEVYGTCADCRQLVRAPWHEARAGCRARRACGTARRAQ